MKRFYRDAIAAPSEGGWRVELDGRAIKTQGGRAQLVPTRALAEALAQEWVGQGEELDPALFALRDLADYALDVIAPDPAETVTALLGYAETDTLCYRAEPGDPLRQLQDRTWDPLLQAAEVRWNVRFERIDGVVHRPQPAATIAALEAVLTALDPFALAALRNTASLAASLVIGLAALEPDADAAALWDAANLEETWQAERWGSDAEAEARQARRRASFLTAVRFAELAQG